MSILYGMDAEPGVGGRRGSLRAGRTPVGPVVGRPVGVGHAPPGGIGEGQAGLRAPGRVWVRAAPARTIAAPTGVFQWSCSPRTRTPAVAAMTGMK